MTENYKGTRRGRAAFGDIGWEMFPEKLESTPIIEDPDQLYNDQRETLRDFSPDTSTAFAYEEPRRNNFSKFRLSLRENGHGTSAEPWVNADSEYDIQFHDKDPRGYSTEQPWNEYRRNVEKRLRMIDFKDDGDYSVPESGIHPNTYYKKIRATQNWLKARLKIFETSWENRHSGGVGVYDNVSNVFKSEYEDTSVLTDGTGMSQTFEDPVVRSRATARLSNIVHMGSKALRVNTTTDHKVPVASYAKLYKAKGLTPHESQMREMEDDTPWTKMEGMKAAPKNLVKLMSSVLEGRTSVDASRVLAGESQTEKEQFRGLRGEEQAQGNRSVMLTQDILALLGFVQNDVKFLTSMEGRNRKSADRALANLYDLSEVVHSLPAHVKLQLRDDLILRAAGGGLRPGSDMRAIQDKVIVNPKIIRFMESSVRKQASIAHPEENRYDADADPENKLDAPLSRTSVFIYRAAPYSEDVGANRMEALPEEKKFAGHQEGKVHSYRTLALSQSSPQKAAKAVGNTQFLAQSESAQFRKNMAMGETNPHQDVMRSEIDVNFGENKALRRHVGQIGTKQMRRHMVSDTFSMDEMNELAAGERKNPRNL